VKEASPCDVCPLKGRPQIQGEGPERLRKRGHLALLGEAPGRTEVKRGKPFIGKTGSLLNKLLESADLDRDDIIIDNALRCPVDDKKQLGDKTIQLAINCCNRRRALEGDLKHARFVVGLGAYAGYALTGNQGVQKVRGCIQQSAWGPSLVTYHPSGLLRGRKDANTRIASDVLAQFVIADLMHAQDYLKGKRGPVLDTVLGPSPTQVERMMHHIIRGPKLYALDVETDSLDMLSANLDIIGIAYPRGEAVRVMVIPMWEGNYTKQELSRIRATLRRLSSVEKLTMIAHNAQYDTTLWERNIGPVKHRIRDTLITHKACWPEVQHDLQNVASQFLLVEPWKFRYGKTEKALDQLYKAWERTYKKWRSNPNEKHAKAAHGAERAYRQAWAKEPIERCTYNGYDVGYTMAVWPHLVKAAKECGVQDVVKVDCKLSEITRRMTIDGIPIRMKRKRSLAKELKKREVLAHKSIKGLIKYPPKRNSMEMDGTQLDALADLSEIDPDEFNPNSPTQVGTLLDAYDVPVAGLTPTGKRSTKRTYLKQYEDMPAVKYLLEYKEVNKLLGTFVEGKGVIVDKHGRLHPSWNVTSQPNKDHDERFGAVSGRWTSSPNMQNWPKSVRDLIGFDEKDPRVVIQADYSQLELRILALLAGEEKLIGAFMEEGRDPHAETASALFGSKFDKLRPDSKKYSELRKMAKTSTYAAMYGAGPNTMHAQVRQDFPDIELKQMQYIHRRFKEMWPAVTEWRDDVLETVYTTGCIRTLFLDRRRVYPLARIIEPDATEIWNFPIQGTAADIMGLRVLKLYPHLPDNTVLFSQVHDAIVVEAMRDKADAVARVIKKHLTWNVRYDGHAMTFPVDVKIGKTWADV
jgi:uracil-DNA glycosylase family 4